MKCLRFRRGNLRSLRRPCVKQNLNDTHWHAMLFRHIVAHSSLQAQLPGFSERSEQMKGHPVIGLTIPWHTQMEGTVGCN
eukprot:1155342-Pelagomonas_calceolata.AAC.7